MKHQNKKWITLVASSLMANNLILAAAGDYQKARFDAVYGASSPAKKGIEAFVSGSEGTSPTLDETTDQEEKAENTDSFASKEVDKKAAKKAQAEAKMNKQLVETFDGISKYRNGISNYTSGVKSVEDARAKAMALRAGKLKDKPSVGGAADLSSAFMGDDSQIDPRCKGNVELSKMSQILGMFEAKVFDGVQKNIDDSVDNGRKQLENIDEKLENERLDALEASLDNNKKDLPSDERSYKAHGSSSDKYVTDTRKEILKTAVGLRDELSEKYKTIKKSWIALLRSQRSFNKNLAKADAEFETAKKQVESKVSGLLAPLALMAGKMSPASIDKSCNDMRNDMAGTSAGLPQANGGSLFQQIMGALFTMYSGQQQAIVTQVKAQELQSFAKGLTCGSDNGGANATGLQSIAGGGTNIAIASFMTSLSDAAKQVGLSKNYQELGESVQSFRSSLSGAKAMFAKVIQDSQKKCDVVAKEHDRKKQWAQQLSQFAQANRTNASGGQSAQPNAPQQPPQL